MNLRLNSLSTHLATVLTSLDASARRRLALSACKLASDELEPISLLVSDSVRELTQEQKVGEAIKAELKSFAEFLDNKYFDIQDGADCESESELEAMSFFCKARFVSGVAYLVEEESLVSSSEAIYEFAIAVEDPDGFVEKLLGTVR